MRQCIKYLLNISLIIFYRRTLSTEIVRMPTKRATKKHTRTKMETAQSKMNPNTFLFHWKAY